MHALLELDCIPAGMELFPAADDSQWAVIQRVIEESDYYMVIVAGRYGSTDESGMSFTEKEYRHALKIGKPVIGFVHSEPGKIAAEKCEPTEDGRKKLDAFRQLVRERLCKPWSDAGALGGAVSRSIAQLKKTKPAVGWIRADQAPTEQTASEVLTLHKRIKE